MKKILILVALATAAFLVSCNSPTSLPPVTATDRDQAMTVMSAIGEGGYASFSYGIVYTPNQISFDPPNQTAGSYATITVVISNYFDATTGYTVSGNLTLTLTNGVPSGIAGVTLMGFSGTMTFSGSGPVRTATFNVTMDITNILTPVLTGTITVNGTLFTY